MNVFILVQEGRSADEGYSIIEVFKEMFALRDKIKKKYPSYKQIKGTQIYYSDKENKYLRIFDREISGE